MVGTRPFAKAKVAKIKSKMTSTRNKGNKGKTDAKPQRGGNADDPAYEHVLRCLQPGPEFVDPRTVEDLQAWEDIAKQYSRYKIRKHHEIMGQLSRMMKEKYRAVAELPAEMQVAALSPELSKFPLNRTVFTDSPPVPGFKGFMKDSN